jgi:UDP-glucose 4-epimerase
MTAYLVTGGAGFIGSHVVEALVKPGNTVRVLDNLTTGTLTNLASLCDQVEVIVGDLHNLALVRSACEGIEVVFHLAAQTAPEPTDASDPPAPPATDTLHVLIAAKETGVRRVIYASCASVYGDPGAAQRVTESAPTTPATALGVSKLIGEQHCVAFTSMYGLDTVRLRYFNVFGPRQPARGRGPNLLALIEAMLAGCSPVIPKSMGQKTWDLSYVGDVVYANLLAAELPRGAGKVFNIGRGRPTTLLDVVSMVNTLLGTHLEPVSEGLGETGPEPFLADVSLAETFLGLCPSTDLEHALRQCVAYYRMKHHPADGVYRPHDPPKKSVQPAASG